MATNEELLLALQQIESSKNLQEPDATVATTGSALWDFLGQARWGVAEQATMGALGAYDVYLEGTYGDRADTWEETLAGDVAGDWDELTNSGKAGYMIGSAVGMIPGFIAGGALANLGVRGLSKIGGVGAKAAVKKSTKELIEEASAIPTKQGMDSVSDLFTDDIAKGIVDDAYDVLAQGSVVNAINKGIGKEVIDISLRSSVKNNIGKTLNIVDDEILEGLSKRTVDIVTRNNPESAEALLKMLANKVPGFRGTPHAHLLLGAMGYDATIGFAMGTIHSAIDTGIKASLGVENTGYHEYQYIKDRDKAYDLNWISGTGDWLSKSFHEAAIFSLFGIVKHAKGPFGGGTSANHLKRFKEMTRNMFKSGKSLKNMTNEELRNQISAMHNLSGKNLDDVLFRAGNKKWSKLPDDWWIKATTDADTRTMRRYLSDVRMEFIKKAPIEFSKEFGKDMLASLPRMMAGVAAMNVTGLYHSFKEHGIGIEGLKNAFGESKEEIAANILTAAYFTRAPHSFKVEASPGVFQKLFQTGKIPEYYNYKQNKLRKMMGAMNAYGIDKNNIEFINSAYRNNMDPDKNVYNNIRRQFDDAPEFRVIENIMKPFEGKESPDGIDLSAAFDRNIAHLLRNGEINFEEAGHLNRKLKVAKTILKFYENETKEFVGLNKYTPEQAFEIVKQVAGMEFAGNKMDVLNVDRHLREFKEKTIIKAIEAPTKILQDFVTEVYRAIGQDVNPDSLTGEFRIPDIMDVLDFGNGTVNKTIATIFQQGQKNNWIKKSGKLPEEYRNITGEQQRQIKELFDNYSERMMDYVWGSKWREQGIELDPLILRDRSWTLAYDDVIRLQQRQVAYEFLSGSKEHGLSRETAGEVYASIEKYFLTRKKPELDIAKGEDAASFGEVNQFLKDLHDIFVDLNPGTSAKDSKLITIQEATGLKESVESLLGDIFTKKTESQIESYNDLKRMIKMKALDKIEISDREAGVDVKASLLELEKDTKINYQGEGEVMSLPNPTLVQENLLMLRRQGKISERQYDEALKHYENIYGIAQRAGYPFRAKEGVTPDESMDWYNSILKSKFSGEIALSDMSKDFSKIYKEMIQDEIDVFNARINYIKMGFNEIPDATRKKRASDELTSLMDDRTALINLKETIKGALDSHDPYTLRAVAKNGADIETILRGLSTNPQGSSRIDFYENVVRIDQNIQNSRQRIAWDEINIQDFVRNEVSSRSVVSKDVSDNALKITSTMFASKYNIPMHELDRLFDIDRSTARSSADIKEFAKAVLRDYWENTREIKDVKLKFDIRNTVDAINRLAGDVPLTLENFNNFIIKPLRQRAQAVNERKKIEQRETDAHVDADIVGIATNYFSKIAVKTLKLDMKNGRLIQDSSVMGKVPNRGFTGLLEYLDPNQNSIFLVEKTGYDRDGRVIRDITQRDLNIINKELKSGQYGIYHSKIESEFYRKNNLDKYDPSKQDSPTGNMFEIIPINESISIAVRVDRSQGSIHRELATQFSEHGELYKQLEAVFDGDFGRQGPKYDAVRAFLADMRSVASAEGNNVESVVKGIKMTRMLLNNPGLIPELIEGKGNINLDHDLAKNTFKYDKLNESRNSYIPTAENLRKTDILYRESTSEVFQNVYAEVKDWFDPNRKIKKISIDDSMEGLKPGEFDIFNSLSRLELELEKRLNDPKDPLDKAAYDETIRLHQEARKSIVDGETFVTRELYLASLAMVGLHPDMIITNKNGEITGFKSGGIKPTISHSKITYLDKSDPNYGRIEMDLNKTAFKYNPVLDALFSTLGVDMITFKSANKINKIKERKGEDLWDMYTGLAPTTNKNDLNIPWNEHILKPGKLNIPQIQEIPLDALSLRTVSKGNHDPSVGANTGVHMHHDNGIAKWIDIESKITKYKDSMAEMYSDPFYRTKLAQEIFGAMSESGDPAALNSGIQAILSREGMILEPWALRRIEENLINYFINNGSIAGGRVPDGSLDVMTASNGQIKSTIRSTIGDRPVTQFFGEFVPSYYAANKQWKPSGVAHNVIIQTIKYTPEKGVRERIADGYLIEIEGERFLQIEGRHIDKDGYLRDIDSGNPITKGKTKDGEQMLKDNKAAFDKALEIESKLYAERDADMNPYMGSEGNRKYLWEIAEFLETKVDMNGNSLSVGMLNVRQPRNMIGDIVISRMGKYEGKYHMPEKSGNVSMMNAIDAIKPQDADFDFDKSFNYVAAPGQFWRETNKLSALITGSSKNPTSEINRLFDPSRGGWLSQKWPDLFEANYSNDMLLSEVNAARGRFIKMHQTVTYLANIFGGKQSVLATFNAPGMIEGISTFEVRLAKQGKYIRTVDNISELAKRFIDAYKNLPAEERVNSITRTQDQVLFGPDGIFEIGYRRRIDPGKFNSVDGFDLQADRFVQVRDAIKMRLINPINRYLKYNKGVEADDVGIERKATLENYGNAWHNLYVKSFDITKDWGIDRNLVNIEPGLTAATRYFDSSRNPYDVAMKQLYNTYNDLVSLKELGVKRGNTAKDEIVEWIENGFAGDISVTDQVIRKNKLFNEALTEYVKDEARVLTILDLRKRLDSINIEIQANENIYRNRNIDTNTKIRNLKRQQSRVSELLSTLEEAVSYMFSKNDPIEANRPKTKFINKFFPEGRYRNNDPQPLVVVGKNGKIKEVIQPGSSNTKAISNKDRVIINGRRFSIADGQQQTGLRVLYEAFSGTPIVTDRISGMRRSYSTKQETQNINNKYNSILSQILSERDSFKRIDNKSRQDYFDTSTRKKQILFDGLFKGDLEGIDPTINMFRKALIMRILTPQTSDKVISIRDISSNGSKRAIKDYMFYENGLSEPLMNLLAEISTGEYRRDLGIKEIASEILEDIQIRKNAAWVSVKNPNMDIELISSRMLTEPGSLKGYAGRQRHLNQDIFDRQDAINKNTRDAAKLMIDYATGNIPGLVDPVLLYKAQLEMEKVGISRADQWGRQEYVLDETQALRNWGTRKVFISEMDAIRRKDLGERGAVKESAQELVEREFDCYK